MTKQELKTKTNGVILDVKFPPVVYKKLLGLELGADDLGDICPELLASLRAVLASADPQLEETMGLVFQYAEDHDGEVRVVDLVPNGGSVPVTQANKELFVRLNWRYILEDSVRRQFDAFVAGFRKVLSSRLLKVAPPGLTRSSSRRTSSSCSSRGALSSTFASSSSRRGTRTGSRRRRPSSAGSGRS